MLPSLKHFAQLDAVNSDEIAKAIRWIEEKNPGSEDRRVGPNVNEDDLVKHIILTRTFFAQKNHDGTTVEEITFNQSRDKVLVFVKVDGLEYSRGYDVVLSKQDGGWHVTGVWFAWISKLQHQTPR